MKDRVHDLGEGADTIRPTRHTNERYRQTASPVRELPAPRKTFRSSRDTGVRQVAARIRRMIRHPMSDQEYAWIGSILADYRARGCGQYREFVGLAGLDSGRIAACDQVYAHLGNGETESDGDADEGLSPASGAQRVSGRSGPPLCNRTFVKEG